MGGSTKRGNKVGRGGGRSRGPEWFHKDRAGGRQASGRRGWPQGPEWFQKDARQEASKVGEGEDSHRGQSGSRKMGPARGKQGG